MDKIRTGIERFQREVFPQRSEMFKQLASGQHPRALFITCADSRIDPSLITQTDPGELFICRNAGNIVPPHTGHNEGMTASIEYAVGALEVPHIIVCGHSHCGAMSGAMAQDKLGNFPYVKQWLTYSQAALEVVDERYPDTTPDERLHRLIEQNVLMQVHHLRTHPHGAARLSTDRVKLHAWVYQIESGEIEAYDPHRDDFLPLAETTPERDGALV